MTRIQLVENRLLGFLGSKAWRSRIGGCPQQHRNTLHIKRTFSGTADIPTLLQQELQDIRIDTNPYELERHGRGESHHPTRKPQAIVFPANTQDVVRVVNLCQQHKIPLIPFGVGTSVEGHICALQGGISLDTSLLQTMELPDIHDGLPDPVATVGAGVTRNALNEALRHTGMQFVVDPGANATLGGMVACGASGTTAVHYGTMRENLLALEVVLPNGQVVNTGTKALKNSAGYDLLGLMCGSEGTLGVITQATVKLHPIPDHIMAAICVFDSVEVAAQVVAALKFQNVAVTRCELLDSSSVAAFNQYNQTNNPHQIPMDEQPTLFLEVQGNNDMIVQAEMARIQDICCDDFGGRQFQQRSDAQERKDLWSARHQLYYASIHLRPEANSAVLTDACVPLSQFASVIAATAQDVEDNRVIGPIFGHAGDGNFHCILPIATEGEDPDYLKRVHEVNDRLIRRTLEVGGTCTGEHGVGYGKAHYLETQYGSGAVEMMRAIKQAIDPSDIMNPGKVVPSKK